jgi:hypothetical protein
LKPIAISLCIALATAFASAASPVDWVVGDVVVAAGNGSYQVWHSADPNAAKPVYNNPPTTISDGVGGSTPGSGCAFDSAYRLFTTNFANSKVVRFSVDNGHGTVPSNVMAPGLTQNESVAFGANGNFYVGYAGTDASNAGLAEFNHNGTLLNSFFSPSITLENSGIDWIDVASDGHTIFYTSEGRKIYKFDTASLHPTSSLYADLSTLSGNGNSGKLFAIRILPPGDGSGGVLVADQSNVKLIKASSNGVITSVQVFKLKNEINLQALTLDPTNLSRFWVGDASTHDLIQFDMSTGKAVVTLNTGTGLGGVCVDGGFSAAQNFAPPKPDPMFPLVRTSTNNTFSFVSPYSHMTFMATLVGLVNPVTVTVHDSLVDPSVAESDATVFSLNPGNPGMFKNGSCPQGSMTCTYSGPLPCDGTFTPSNSCEVFEFEANPPLDASVTANVQICSDLGCGAPDDNNPLNPYVNPRLLRDLDEDITDGINVYPLSGTRNNCVYTVNDQKFDNDKKSCGFQSPSQDQNFTKTQGSSIPFKFVAVKNNGTCPPSTSNALVAGDITPLLMITKLAPRDAMGEPTAAPISETVIVKGNSGGFPIFTFSGNTWQLQVDTSNLPIGNYLATVIDLQNKMPAFGVNFTLQ